jgi:N-acetylneuraminic acid mutarotase
MSHLVWEERRPLPQPRTGSASGIVNRNIIVAGGTDWNGDVKRWLDRVDVYDIQSNEWHSGPPLQRPFAYGGFAATNQGFEVFGGCETSGGYRDCWRLERGGKGWQHTGAAPENLVFTSVETHAGHIYAFGGSANERELEAISGAVWMREADGSWFQLAVLPRRDLIMAAHAQVNGRAYFFGGCSQPVGSALANHDDAISFDFGTHEWTRLRSLPLALRGASAVAVDGRTICIIGGYTGTAFSTAVWVYDTVSDIYKHETPLPVGLVGTSFVLDQDTLYGAGGEDRMRGRSPRLLAGRLNH